MRRFLILIALPAALVGYVLGRGEQPVAQYRTVTERATLIPACPPSVRTAGGNLEPLFCTVDNPAALAYYGRSRVLRLGDSAGPPQVLAAARADSRHGFTHPEICAAFDLAKRRWHWTFAFPAAAGVGAARAC